MSLVGALHQGSYQSRGLKYSGLIHAILLLLMIFGLPSWFQRDIPEPTAMTVEILPISQISNVKPSEQMPEKPKEEPKVEPKPATAKQATQEASKPLEEKKPDAVPLPQEKKPVKKEEPKPKKEEVKKKEESLDSILKSVQDMAKKEKSETPTEQAVTPEAPLSKSQNYDPTLPLSLSQKDAIRQQIERNWNAPIGAKDAQNLIVVLRIEVMEDGTIKDVKLARDNSRYTADSFFRAAADSAIRAVWKSSPLKDLPQDKFGAWNDMELTFDPKEALF
jgi:outer membrane biosynthesis protein TonB